MDMVEVRVDVEKDSGPGPGERVKGVTILKPIVYGNVARYLGGKRPEDGHTHEWTLYLRPLFEEEMELYVKKVVFKLHESYENPTRVVSKPPYEVCASGWGEFEIQIKIHFVDSNERPVTLFHLLRLMDVDPVSGELIIRETLTSEFYDEILFQDPTHFMQSRLLDAKQFKARSYKGLPQFAEKMKIDEERILMSKEKVKNEVHDTSERLEAVRKDILKYREALEAQGGHASQALKGLKEISFNGPNESTK